MNDLGHGANVDDMAAQYNKNPESILDFSANINPYTIDQLEHYILQGVKRSNQYPDIHYTQLKQNIAQYLGCSESFIIPGNGATEIMYLLMKCIEGPLAIINPTFSEYERSARLNHMPIVDFYLNKHRDFSLNLDEISSRMDEFETLFICNPNNPTGKVQNIKPLLELLTSGNKPLIVDETFMEFVEDEKSYSLLDYAKDYPNLIIIKAATKFFGLPGIRLGYGVTSNRKLIEQMHFYKEPWTVNSFAELLGHYIFKEEQYIQRTKDYFKEERKRIIAELRTVPYFKTYDTDANFILMEINQTELKGLTAKVLKQRLFKEYNILIRDASNFKGLDAYFIRIAIKTQEQNNRIIRALKDDCLAYLTDRR